MSTRNLIQKLIPSHLVSKDMFDNSWPTTTAAGGATTTSTTTTWIIIVWHFFWLGPPQLLFNMGRASSVDDPFTARRRSSFRYLVGLLYWAYRLQVFGPVADFRPENIVVVVIVVDELLCRPCLWRRVGIIWCCCCGGSGSNFLLMIIIIILLN